MLTSSTWFKRFFHGYRLPLSERAPCNAWQFDRGIAYPSGQLPAPEGDLEKHMLRRLKTVATGVSKVQAQGEALGLSHSAGRTGQIQNPSGVTSLFAAMREQ
jgi:hypothetical protein